MRTVKVRFAWEAKANGAKGMLEMKMTQDCCERLIDVAAELGAGPTDLRSHDHDDSRAFAVCGFTRPTLAVLEVEA